MILVIAIATVGAIGIGATEHAFAQGFPRFGPGQDDNNQGNNNNQGALSCRGGFGSFGGNCENVLPDTERKI